MPRIITIWPTRSTRIPRIETWLIEKMITELNNINNSSVRERVERAIVKPILSTKAHFGLGVPKKSDSKKPKNLMKKVAGAVEMDRSAS